MPLQNRVDPFGAIHAVAARGLLTGNRGVIHDPGTGTLLSRRWTTKAWIVCDLVNPRGVERTPMGRNAPSGGAGWTELFFLDEPTALAAGHRPCFYCRREAAVCFARAFAAGQGREAMPAPRIDAVLHGERLASAGRAGSAARPAPSKLPDGAFVAIDGRPFAVRGDALLPWSFSGYGPAVPRRRAVAGMILVTPPATVAALAAGYRPAWHASAYPSPDCAISGTSGRS